jgi:hypothetical protein
MMNSVELDFREWLSKVSERVTFALLNIKDHRDISDDDYDLLRVLYKAWWNGEHPLYATKMSGTAELSVQNTLFSQDVSCTEPPIFDGTEIDTIYEEPIN